MEVQITAAVAEFALADFTQRAETAHNDGAPWEVVGMYRDRAERMARVLEYLRTEPGVVSASFDTTSDLYWPLCVVAERYEAASA